MALLYKLEGLIKKEEASITLGKILTQDDFYALLYIPKPKSEWNKIDRYMSKKRYEVMQEVGFNFYGSYLTVLHDPESDEWYELNKRKNPKIILGSYPFSFNERDKARGNSYLFDGSFSELKEELVKNGFEIREEKNGIFSKPF